MKKYDTKKHEKSESKSFEKQEDRKTRAPKQGSVPMTGRRFGPVATQNKLVSPSKTMNKLMRGMKGYRK